MAEQQKLFVFDTSVALLPANAAPSEPDELERLLEFIDANKHHRLAVTAPGYAECAGFRLRDDWECLPLDMVAATAAQDLHTAVRGLQKDGKSRQALKIDALILATAVTHGASCLYTSDSDIVQMAKLLTVNKPPFVGKLPPLGARQIKLSV